MDKEVPGTGRDGEEKHRDWGTGEPVVDMSESEVSPGWCPSQWIPGRSNTLRVCSMMVFRCPSEASRPQSGGEALQVFMMTICDSPKLSLSQMSPMSVQTRRARKSGPAS